MTKFVSVREVAERAGKHPGTIRRWWEQGLLPPPRKTGPNSIGFVDIEIDAWFASRPTVEPRK